MMPDFNARHLALNGESVNMLEESHCAKGRQWQKMSGK